MREQKMRIHLHRKLMFVISCLMMLTMVSGCSISTELIEKSLPPVFSDMNVLGSKYFDTLIFPPFDTSNWVFTHQNDYLQAEPAELTINSSLPPVPDKLIAYKIIRPVVDEAYARELTQRIGFNGALSYFNTDDTYRAGDTANGSPVISIYRDGSIGVWYDRSNRESSPPPDEECINIARNWLNSNGLYPKGVINVKTLPFVIDVYKDAPEGLTFWNYTCATTVIFSMNLNGYELFGMGAILNIGENGKVMEVHINAPEFEPYCDVKVKQPEAAIGTLRDYLQNPSKFGADSPECLISGLSPSIQVNNISLKYFAMMPADASQPVYAQPVYITYGKGDKPGLPSNAFIVVDAV